MAETDYGFGSPSVVNTGIAFSLLPNADNTYDLGSTTLGWRVIYVAGSVQSEGLGANVPLNLYAKGTTFVNLGNGVGQPWFTATGPATGTTNFVQATGELVGVAPGVNAVGLDPNISITYYAKNAGAVALGTLTSPSTSTQFATFLGSVSSVNYFQFQSGLTGARIEETAIGFDPNIDIMIGAKGASGVVHLASNAIYTWDAVLNGTGANRLQTNARSAGSTPDITAVGADAIIDIGINPKGATGAARITGGLGVTGSLGFFSVALAAQQVSGANLTNSVTSGGSTDVITNYTDLTTYANDAAAIRNDIYQLARKLKQVNDALRLYGLLT